MLVNWRISCKVRLKRMKLIILPVFHRHWQCRCEKVEAGVSFSSCSPL
uniref:Uncharacterized protein n=1 Tax=Anguilla anguilla TaxID=7936 RepID=A0A0E9T4J1_ANGAN